MRKPTPRSRQHCVLLVLCLVFSLNAFPQRHKSEILQYDHTTYAGSVELSDGNRLEGDLVFNDNDGILTVFTDGESRSFNARSIARFDFYDDRANRLRVFYSLMFTDPDTGIKDSEIFEILKELESFVVLSKIDRLKTEARKGVLAPRTSPMLVDRDSRKFTQTETVYFLDGEADFLPYLKIVEKEFDWQLIDYNEKSNRLLDADLFPRFTGVHFPELVTYAKENKLSFKRKSDIVRILDEYERIINN